MPHRGFGTSTELTPIELPDPSQGYCPLTGSSVSLVVICRSSGLEAFPSVCLLWYPSSAPRCRNNRPEHDTRPVSNAFPVSDVIMSAFDVAQGRSAGALALPAGRIEDEPYTLFVSSIGL